MSEMPSIRCGQALNYSVPVFDMFCTVCVRFSEQDEERVMGSSGGTSADEESIMEGVSDRISFHRVISSTSEGEVLPASYGVGENEDLQLVTALVPSPDVDPPSKRKRVAEPGSATRPLPNLTPISFVESRIVAKKRKVVEIPALPASWDERVENMVSAFHQSSATAKKKRFKRASDEEKELSRRHVEECIELVASGGGEAYDMLMGLIRQGKRIVNPTKRRVPPELKKPSSMDPVTERHVDECINNVARGTDSLSEAFGVALERTESDDERSAALAACPPPPPKKRLKRRKVAPEPSVDEGKDSGSTEPGARTNRSPSSKKRKKSSSGKTDRARTNDLVHCVFGDGPGQAAYRRKGSNGKPIFKRFTHLYFIALWTSRVPSDHLLLDRSLYVGPLISRWELENSKIVETKALEPLKS